MLIEAFHSYSNLLRGLGHNLRRCTIRVNLSRGDRVEYSVSTTYPSLVEPTKNDIESFRNEISDWFALGI